MPRYKQNTIIDYIKSTAGTLLTSLLVSTILTILTMGMLVQSNMIALFLPFFPNPMILPIILYTFFNIAYMHFFRQLINKVAGININNNDINEEEANYIMQKLSHVLKAQEKSKQKHINQITQTTKTSISKIKSIVGQGKWLSKDGTTTRDNQILNALYKAMQNKDKQIIHAIEHAFAKQALELKKIFTKLLKHEITPPGAIEDVHQTIKIQLQQNMDKITKQWLQEVRPIFNNLFFRADLLNDKNTSNITNAQLKEMAQVECIMFLAEVNGITCNANAIHKNIEEYERYYNQFTQEQKRLGKQLPTINSSHSKNKGVRSFVRLLGGGSGGENKQKPPVSRIKPTPQNNNTHQQTTVHNSASTPFAKKQNAAIYSKN